jgi:hypothetical protein
MGLAAEVYADTPDELEHVLRFVSPHPYRPMVHLNRGVNVLNEPSRAVVGEFADRFAGRVASLVVHDQYEMGEQTHHLLSVMRELDARLGERSGVLDVIRSIGSIGKHVHFHLHDGHPLIRGLPDHFTFLTRLPIPFSYQGRRSLSMMYGPGGLASIVSAATGACRPDAVSFMLEIHQVEGRLPLADASRLFARWQDITNAERMNYWLCAG